MNAAGLFEDFLQHEVRITALLQLAEIERYRLYLVRTFHILQVNNLQLLSPTDEGNLFVFQIHHLIRVFHNRRGIRSQEKLSFTDAHHQRTALACSDYPIRIVLVEHRNGIRPNHFLQGKLHRRQQVNMVCHLNVFNELYQHLGISAAFKYITFGLKFFFKDGVVFNNAVMDEGEAFGRGIMGMGIDGTRFSMSGPTCMCNTNATGNIFLSNESFKFRNLTFRFVHVQLSVITD